MSTYRCIFFLHLRYKCIIIDAMKNLGIEKLKKEAQKKGLKQADIAEMTGITQGAISHYFTGRREKVDPENAKKFSTVFPSINFEDFYTFLNENAA